VVVAGFLALFTPFNLYWAFGGKWGLLWVVGCDDCIPLAAVWVQQVLLIAGIVIVLGRSGIWRLPLPAWTFSVGIWGMVAAFGGVALQNLLSDNRAQARFLFVPASAALCALCVMVATSSTRAVVQGANR
jgi:hypothetical protein